jgi:uncharacterized membrane-anchored protein YhcB (DUF1043 family)
VYGLAWLIVWALLGVAAGAALGVAFATRRSNAAVGRTRELEAQLESARSDLSQYRQEAVAQFTETARKFQSLNDAYTDLHQQLAKSSSILCGDISSPLLEAPRGHQDVLVSSRSAPEEPDPEDSPDRQEMTATPEAASAASPPSPDSEPSPASRGAEGAQRDS